MTSPVDGAGDQMTNVVGCILQRGVKANIKLLFAVVFLRILCRQWDVSALEAGLTEGAW